MPGQSRDTISSHTKRLPNQFQNNFGSEIPPPKSPNIIPKRFGKGFGKGFGNPYPLLTLLIETKQFQKHVSSVITEQELPKIIIK